MLDRWNDALDTIERTLAGDVDVSELARRALTSEFHFRRVFSALAGMPVSEYVRRRRMTLAAADVVAGDTVVDVAVRYGYGSAESFRRAFVAVHGATPDEVRHGAPVRAQSRLRFHLTIEGSTPMEHRILTVPAHRLVGASARLPLVYSGPNEALVTFQRELPRDLDARLAPFANVTGLDGTLSVSTDFAPDRADGSEFTFLIGVATTADAAELPDEFAVIEVPELSWVAFDIASDDDLAGAIQQGWASAFGEWFPSNPYRLVPAPEVLAFHEQTSAGGGRAELRFAVERVPSPSGGTGV